MSRPRITQRIIEGILDSTSEHLAGNPEALEAIVESATDGRNCPEWLQERVRDAEAALRQARGEL